MIDIIKSLFVQRYDTYAIQNANGSYIRIENKLKDSDITEHLHGKTIGIYQFNKDNKCKWVCFDFDGEDLEQQLQLAKILYLKIRDEEKVKSVLLEFSGKKGYHVWVFCEEIDGTSAKIWAEDIAKDYGVHEVFPKQIQIQDKFGSLVKLPLGIHKMSGKRSVLFDSNFNELDFEKSKEFLIKFSNLPKYKIPRIIVKEIIRTIIQPRGKTQIPSFIQSLLIDGVKEGERNKYRYIIIKELFNAGYSNDEILACILTFNKNCTPPDNENIVEYHVRKTLEYPERYLAKESIENVISPQELSKIASMNYENVMDVFKKWMYFEDDTIIDLCLAVAIARKEPIPLWFILIAPSGSGKSEILRPFEDMNKPSTTEVMSKITKNTFLSGVKDEPDFANTLSNNPKLFLTFDFAQFVKLNSDEKAQIWAQLRDLYDGFLERKAAFMVNKKANNIKVNWLICSTPVVDSELLVQQELGTRELLYRFKHEKLDETQLMSRIWMNLDKAKEMRNELSFCVRKFIEKKESEGLHDITVTDEIKKKIMDTALMIATLRAATESDKFTGELENFVYKEMPTRILLQLKTLFKALKNLDTNYTDERALQVITRVALSSIHPIRLRIILLLMESGEISTTEIQKKIGIGWKTVITQLYTARQLGLVSFYEDAYSQEDSNKNWKKKLWSVTNNHPVIKYLRTLEDVKDMLDYYYKTDKISA